MEEQEFQCELCRGPHYTNLTLLPIVKRITDGKAEPDDANTIAEVIKGRLTERYITPLLYLQNEQESIVSGFIIMTNMCLLIETLQAFREGVKSFYRQKEGKIIESKDGKDAFINFLTKYQTSLGEVTAEQAEDFYYNIRCALLHQGEVANKWLLKHIEDGKGTAIEWGETKKLDAPHFMEKMKTELEKYTQELPKNQELLMKAAEKLEHIIENCTISFKLKIKSK